MKAVVMAGGFGLRLHPLTFGCPKVMVTFVNKPVLACVLELLKRHGFNEVIITVQHLADQIIAYFGDGESFGLTIHYAIETTRLGSAGGVGNARQYLDDEPFLVISGDIVTDFDLSHVIRCHQQSQALATIAAQPIDDPRHYGVAKLDAQGRILEYTEKPKEKPEMASLINAGLYMFEPEILDYIEPGVVTDFAYDIFPKLLAQNHPFYGCLMDGNWYDIGAGIPNYKRATTAALLGEIKHLDLGHPFGDNQWQGENVTIGSGAKLYGPIYLGDKVVVGDGATIIGPTVVGDHTVIGERATIEQSIIGRGCFISEAAHMKNVVMPNDVA